jgi:quercetin dioxygenase-like cupin family protein
MVKAVNKKGGLKMPQRPKPKTVQLDPAAEEYQRILGGPPESVTMHSGYVVLQQGNSVGRHNTDVFEEMVIVLDGEGEMILEDGTALPLKPYVVAYCPPETEHDVRNTGGVPLRYVYVVAMG